MTRSLAASLAAFLTLGGPPAVARNLDALARQIVPAYVAMQYSMVCAQESPAFLRYTAGPRGTALEYAQHVKDEVIASLWPEEAAIVVKKAADEARTTALATVRGILGNTFDDSVESRLISAWCITDGRKSVREFITRHDSRHQEFLAIVAKAKQ